MQTPHAYGWLPDATDHRDQLFAAPNIELPDSVDLRPHMPPVYDQGKLGSCTANAIAAALDYQRFRQGEAFITPSRLFIYWNERSDSGQVNQDAGATIRESVKAVKRYGACPENEWPYIVSKFKLKPPAKSFRDALNYEDVFYQRVSQDVTSIKTALATGTPVVIGIKVYESFESPEAAKSGQVPLPRPSEKLLGGHAVLVSGYENGQWIVRNSWGAWGDNGYFYLPENYLTNVHLSGDFWALTLVK